MIIRTSSPNALELADLEKPHWGNHEATLRFLDGTDLLREPRKILEIGCGKGHVVAHLQQQGHQVTGIDNDPLLIEECRRIYPGLAVQVGDALNLDFPSGSFDVVLSFDVFEHLEQSDQHLREVRRVLRPGGSYLLQTPNKWTNMLFEPIRCVRKYGWRNAFIFLKPPEHCALHNYWQLQRRFKRMGFTVQYHDVPVLNEFFRDKVRRFLGKPGTWVLRVVNPDRFPRPLRTNFFVSAVT